MPWSTTSISANLEFVVVSIVTTDLLGKGGQLHYARSLCDSFTFLLSSSTDWQSEESVEALWMSYRPPPTRPDRANNKHVSAE